MSAPALLWAPAAWLHGGWRERVLLRIARDGRFGEVTADVDAPADATVLGGPVLPGMVDAHSHAFQRAFAGLAERRDAAQDDFWSWRERMYDVALRISPAALEAVATQLYTELLAGGYTQVCEFHYLQHAPDGSPYADRLTMCHALVRAAHRAGIGLTLLPVLYERAGFAEPALRGDQRRFATTVDEVLALRDGIRALAASRVTAGVAIHSLRAARPASIAELLRRLEGDEAPVHIHIAEQTAEVADCLAATGMRPIEWLATQVALDRRWQLVHATHASAHEIDAVARAGAGVVLCPNTEANLGDGLCDLGAWLERNTVLSIGSDSQIGRHAAHELRLLEYGQRLVQRRRNLAAAPERGLPSTAARLFDRCSAGGAAAAGYDRWGLREGARADLLVLDMRAPGLLGVPMREVLDALVFATDAPALREVWVGGACCLVEGRHRAASSIADAFVDAMRGLWPAGGSASRDGPRVAPT